jgi:myosin heavy subunit
VPIIVLSVIVVGLLASTIVLGMKVSDLQDLLEYNKKQLKAEKDKRQEDLNGFREYENLVGLDQDAAKADFNKLRDELMDTAPLPGEDRGAPPDNMKNLLRRYADRTKLLADKVDDHLREIQTAKQDLEELRQQVEQLEKSKQEAIDQAEARYAKLQGEKEQVEGKLQTTSQELNTQIDQLKATRQQLQTKLDSVTKDVELLKKTIAQKDELIDKLRNPPKPKTKLVLDTQREPADGKVLTVESDGQYVMIDVGRQDWVSEGMEFRVFDETNPDARKEKGRIQVRRVYDTISQAKILEQDPMDPILRDMVIVNPAFSRGRKLNFVLEGRFEEPNVERLLSRYPCEIQKNVTRDTDYMVVGQARRRPGEPSWKDSENAGLAEKYRVPILMERDLLRYLGED